MEIASLIVNTMLISGLILYYYLSYVNNKKSKQQKEYIDKVSETITKQFEEVKEVVENKDMFYVKSLRIILPELERLYSENNQYTDAAACRDLLEEVNKMCSKYQS